MTSKWWRWMWPWGDNPQDGGEEARREAEKHLADARKQRPMVSEVSASLRELRERENHFADRIERLIRGGVE